MPTWLKNLSVIELSLVDNPANKDARIMITKRAEQGDAEVLARFNLAVKELAGEQGISLDAARKRTMLTDPEGWRAWERVQIGRAEKRAKEIKKAEGCHALVAIGKAWAEIEAAERCEDIANKPVISTRCQTSTIRS